MILKKRPNLPLLSTLSTPCLALSNLEWIRLNLVALSDKKNLIYSTLLGMFTLQKFRDIFCITFSSNI